VLYSPNVLEKLSDKSFWRPKAPEFGGTQGAQTALTDSSQPLFGLRNRALLELSDSF
jgi:hypothetical protein